MSGMMPTGAIHRNVDCAARPVDMRCLLLGGFKSCKGCKRAERRSVRGFVEAADRVAIMERAEVGAAFARIQRMPKELPPTSCVMMRANGNIAPRPGMKAGRETTSKRRLPITPVPGCPLHRPKPLGVLVGHAIIGLATVVTLGFPTAIERLAGWQVATEPCRVVTQRIDRSSAWRRLRWESGETGGEFYFDAGKSRASPGFSP